MKIPILGDLNEKLGKLLWYQHLETRHYIELAIAVTSE